MAMGTAIMAVAARMVIRSITDIDATIVMKAVTAGAIPIGAIGLGS